jgi:hypothetical protein
MNAASTVNMTTRSQTRGKMARLLMLAVTGGNAPPYRKLVSVEDPVRFLGIMRAKALKEQIDYVTNNYVPGQETEDVQADILRTLKVKLFETGLKEYPETDAEVEALYRRFDDV